MPKFITIAAVSLDGKIALNKNHPSRWTSKEDKTFMCSILNRCDVVIVGNNTYKASKKALSKRNTIVFTSKTSKPIKQNPNLILFNPSTTNIKKFVEIKKYDNIAILGGTQIYTHFLQKNLINELYLTIEPVVFGKGLNLFDGDLKKFKTFTLISIKKLNKSGTVLLHYKKLG